MDPRIDSLIKNWQKRNIQGIYCADRQQAREKILALIPPAASVGLSGSVTLDELGIAGMLKAWGARIFNQYKPGISQQESLELRKQGSRADYYLASPNAVSEKGELVFFSAFGNRTAGICSCPNVVLVAGINKITPNIEEALRRAREYVTPLNCRRLNYNTPCLADGRCHQEVCLFPEYKRMCCQVLIIEAEMNPARLKVILVGEKLGF